jgi:hypothetical protein
MDVTGRDLYGIFIKTGGRAARIYMRRVAFDRCASNHAGNDLHLACEPRRQGAILMMDVVMLAIGLGFFVLTIGYCYACDRL